MSNKHFTLLAILVTTLALVAGISGCSGPVPAPTQAPAPTQSPATAVPPTQPAAPTAVASPTQPAPTSTPTSIPASPTATPAAAFTATLKTTANVRSGPGTGYPLLGSLAPGLTVQIKGRNADKSWWQIEFAPSPTGLAWVSAASTSIGAGALADALPTVSVPPAPTRSPGSAPSVPANQTPAIPNPAGPTPVVSTSVLRADKDTLTPGECTTLRWDVDNFKEVFLKMPSEEVPVAGHEARPICLDATTTYVLRVVNSSGATQNYAFTVKVSEDCADKQTEIKRLTISANQIRAGETATISWDVTCAQGVYFKEGTGAGPRQQMMRHDSVDLQPTQSTTYRLFVIALDGSEIRRDIRIEVVP